MDVELSGARIKSEVDFHRELSSALGLPGYYGANVYALWDVMTTDVERPLRLVWHDSAISQAAMPEIFEALVNRLRDVEKYDIELGYPDRFTLVLD